MYLDRYLRLIAGTVVLASVALAYFVDIRWLILTSFVGVSLLLGGAIAWCPMISILRSLGVRELPEGCARV
jgi:zinc transporter ZupT